MPIGGRRASKLSFVRILEWYTEIKGQIADIHMGQSQRRYVRQKVGSRVRAPWLHLYQVQFKGRSSWSMLVKVYQS